MRPNKLKQKLNSGEVVFGAFVYFSEPGLVEILGHAGYDFVVMDMEHTTMNIGDIPELLRAADAVGITPIVRVGERNAHTISRVLDVGAHGVMIPHLMDAEDAKEMVGLTRYPPIGSRTTCTAVRANQYTATSFVEHVKQSNDNIILVGLIEDASAADAIGEIIEIPGVDVVMPGPGDLSTSLNVPGNFEHPLVIEKVEKVIKTTVSKNKTYPGMYISSADQAKRWLNEGVKFIVYSIDNRVIFNAYRDALAKIKSFLK